MRERGQNRCRMQIACVMYTQLQQWNLITPHSCRHRGMFRSTSSEEASWFASSLVCLCHDPLQGGPEVRQPERSSFHPNRLSNYWWLQMPRGFDQDFCTRPCITTDTSTRLLFIIVWSQHTLKKKKNHLAGNGLHRKGWFIELCFLSSFLSGEASLTVGVGFDIFHVLWVLLQWTVLSPPVSNLLGTCMGFGLP